MMVQRPYNVRLNWSEAKAVLRPHGEDQMDPLKSGETKEADLSQFDFLVASCGCAARGTVWCRLAGASLSPGWTSAAALLTSRSKARSGSDEMAGLPDAWSEHGLMLGRHREIGIYLTITIGLEHFLPFSSNDSFTSSFDSINLHLQVTSLMLPSGHLIVICSVSLSSL